MADDNANDENNEEGTDPKPNSGKALREKLEATLTENAELKGQLLIHNAGLSHLSEKQRNAAIRDATDGGTELTVENLKKSAQELGFPAAPVSQNGKEGGTEGGEGNDGNDGDTDDEREPANGMEAIEQAQRRMRPVGEDTFEKKMKEAKTQQELEALIRTEGHKVGIVHEWDVV